MRSLLSLCFASLAAFVPIADEASAQDWQSTVGDPVASEYIRDLRVLDDDGVLFCATSYVQNNGRLQVVRTNALGQVIWDVLLDLTPYDERAFSVRPTQDGCVVVVGIASFVGNLAPSPLAIKLDATGTVIWNSADTFSPTFPIDAGWTRGIELPSGEIALVGWSTLLPTKNQRWVARISADGALLAVDTYAELLPGWFSTTVLWDVEETADGGFAVTGTCGPAPATAMIWKLDAAAQEEWVRTYEGTLSIREGRGIRATSDGGFLIAGTSSPNATGTALVRFDSQGSPLWTQDLSLQGNDYSAALDVVELPTGELRVVQQRFSALGAQNVRSFVLSLDANGDEIAAPIEVIAGAFGTSVTHLALSGDGSSLTAGGLRNDIGYGAQLDTALERWSLSGIPLVSPNDHTRARIIRRR